MLDQVNGDIVQMLLTLLVRTNVIPNSHRAKRRDKKVCRVAWGGVNWA